MSVTDDLHRIIGLKAVEGAIHGRVQDNVHDFKVVLQHDGAVITEVTAETVRSPFTTCASARAGLAQLVGRAIGNAGPPRIDIGLQCTHMFDLAVLAGAHAGRGGERRYRIDAALQPGGSVARIERDGSLVLDWQVQGDRIVTPGAFEGLGRSGAITWPAEVLAAPDLLEAALILRRCLLVLHGRPRSLGIERAEEMRHMPGACHTFQPDQMRLGVRPEGFQDYSTAALKRILAANS